MMRGILSFILFYMLCPVGLEAQSHYEPDMKCCDITLQILDLKIETAKKNIQEQLKLSPDNYYLYYLDQYADFVHLLVAANDERYLRLQENYELYREIMDGKDEDSPYYLFILSTMQMQLSLAKLKFGDSFSGLNLAVKSYRNMQDNIDLHPDFYGNKKLRGLYNVMLGNIPPFLRTMAGLFGVKPGRESTNVLLSAYKSDVKGKPGLSTEASIFIPLSLLLNKQADLAYEYISQLDSSYYKIFLVNYFYGNLAFHNADNEAALMAFEKMNIEKLEVKFYPYYYMYGKALMNKLDDRASIYLQTFIDETVGFDYLKQAHLYLGYHYLMRGDKLRYEEQLLRVKKEGKDKTERDREALLDLRKGYTPDPVLLKTAFLLKGSYFPEADTLLQTYHLFNNIFLPYQLEYLLLRGLIDEGLGNIEEAIPFYESVVEKGSDKNYDFATRACLRLGGIYEYRKGYNKALAYYKEARHLYKSDFYESYEDRAKKGIKRMEAQTFTNE